MMPALKPKIDSIDFLLMAAADQVNRQLEFILQASQPSQLQEAMKYAALGGGKRLRAFIVLESCKMFGVPETQALQVAAALELIHTYSLIHDDLPCMDDALLRRGRPTCHLAFDEATAVLAGDALLTLAFEVLASAPTHPDPQVRCQLVSDLAKLAGGREGMVLGQMFDMLADAPIEKIALLKTGCLLGFAASSGATLAQAPLDDYNTLVRYGEAIGIAYQMVDDVLDHISSTEKLGKDSQIDDKNEKTNFVFCYGVEKTQIMAEQMIAQAKDYLQPFGEKSIVLERLSDYILKRDY